MLRAPWENFINAAPEGDPVVAAEPPELPRSPAARRAVARRRELEAEAELARAWISPRRAPWEEPTRSPQWPLYWNAEYPILDPVETVMLPTSPSKGSGPGSLLPPEEVEALRAAERAAFARRLAQRWRWNLFHL